MEELKINGIIDLFKKANFHIDLCMGRSNGKHEFSKINKAMKQIPDLLEELKKYRVKEEQGLLLRLPCHVSDPVYRIMGDGFIMKSIVEEFVFTNTVYVIVRDELLNARRGIEYCEMGRTMFLTREEAEAALKKMQEGE